jgi:phosphate transport system substrate-binding protein
MCAGLWCGDSSQSFADTVIIQGSTTFARRIMEPHKATIEQDSKHEITLIPNKSLPGLIALIEGRAQMSMISSSLKSEITALEKVMPGLDYERLQAHEIDTTRIAIAIHGTNPVRQTSLNQVRKVLLGEIRSWSALGGRNIPIRIVLVGGGGGVTTVIESELLEGKPVKGPNVTLVKTPVQLVRVVEQEPGAMGFAQLALVKQRGMPELSTDTPIEQTLSFVTLGDPTAPLRDIIEATRRVAEKIM